MEHFADGGGVTYFFILIQTLIVYLLNGYMFYISLRATHVSTVH